ncbi:MAG: VOC family protein [Actinobacteria bacterium]|nr:MAG: VOC family protein [Actinomycetota bacterium]
MGRVIHFELSAKEPERAVRFYTDVFGWQIRKWEGPQEYYLATTGPEGEPGIDGAILPAGEEGPKTVNTIGVEKIEDALSKTRQAGGQVVTEVTEVPGVGRFAYCLDTEGNQFGVIESTGQGAA